MAKVKNISGVALIVPAHGGLVLDGHVIEVADESVYGLTQQAIWQPSDKAAKDAHAAGEKARDERLAAQDRERHGLHPKTDEVAVAGDSNEE